MTKEEHDDRLDYLIDRARREGTDFDMLRPMVQFMAQQLVEIDVQGRCGAGYNQNSPERLNSRNGYRDRILDTGAGTVELKVSKLRTGSYFPEFLEPRRTAELALRLQSACPTGSRKAPVNFATSSRHYDCLVQAGYAAPRS